MEKLKDAQKRLVSAIVAMHPELCMGDEKEKELYLAMHDMKKIMANSSDSQKQLETKATLCQDIRDRFSLFVKEQKDLNPEFVDVVNEKFWDLI